MVAPKWWCSIMQGGHHWDARGVAEEGEMDKVKNLVVAPARNGEQYVQQSGNRGVRIPNNNDTGGDSAYVVSVEVGTAAL